MGHKAQFKWVFHNSPHLLLKIFNEKYFARAFMLHEMKSSSRGNRNKTGKLLYAQMAIYQIYYLAVFMFIFSCKKGKAEMKNILQCLSFAFSCKWECWLKATEKIQRTERDECRMRGGIASDVMVRYWMLCNFPFCKRQRQPRAKPSAPQAPAPHPTPCHGKIKVQVNCLRLQLSNEMIF